MILLCLVPFSSARQAAGIFSPGAPLSPVNEAPAPVNEEDDERETADAKERIVSQSRHRLAGPTGIGLLPLASNRHVPLLRHLPTSPSASDPFRNGLGTPYRC